MAVGRRPLFLALDLVIGLSVPTTWQLVFSRETQQKARSYSIVHEPASGVMHHYFLSPLGVTYTSPIHCGRGQEMGALDTLLEAGNHSPCLQNAHLNVLSSVRFPLFNVILPVLQIYT